MMVKLQVAISTCGEDAMQKVAAMRLPRVDGVGYLISCQSAPLDIPAELRRDDVRVFFTSSRGISNNRNYALSLVTAPYVLIADDDLVYDANGLAEVIRVYDSDPTLDYATFRFAFPYSKTYPEGEWDLSRKFSHYNPISFEISFRMESYRRAGLHFSTYLGLGAPYANSGEEDVVLYNCRRKRLHGKYFPVIVGEHPNVPGGRVHKNAPAKLRTMGAVAVNVYPGTAILRLPLIAHRAPGNTLRNLFYVVQGACYGLCHRKQILN